MHFKNEIAENLLFDKYETNIKIFFSQKKIKFLYLYRQQ